MLMTRTAAIYFDDGRWAEFPLAAVDAEGNRLDRDAGGWTPKGLASVIGIDDTDLPVANDPTPPTGDRERLQFTLTPCCGATFKGGGSGIICRCCYRDADYGSGGLAFGEIVPRVTAARFAELMAEDTDD